MKKLLFLLLLAFTAGMLMSQTIADYTYATSTDASLFDMSSGTTDLLPTGTYYDDTASAVTNIGFVFKLGGFGFSQFTINANGQIQLGSTPISGSNPVPAANTCRIAAISGDNCIRATGKVHYKVEGTQPDRRLIVEWVDLRIPLSSSTETGTYCKIQTILYETSNKIEFIYGQMYNMSTSTAARGIYISTSNTAGTIGQILTIITTPTWNVSQTSLTTTSFLASNYITNLNSSADGSRRKFSFTPPAVTVTPNVAGIVSPSNTATNVSVLSTLNWSDGGGWADGFKLYFSPTSSFPPETPMDLDFVTTYDPPGSMEPSTAYSWKIVPYNDNGDNTTGSTWTFTTGILPLAGAYTIDPAQAPSTTNFQTFAAAVNALNGAGISGSVTFNVAAGAVFVEEVPIITATGTSSWSITFQKSGEGANPVIKPTTSTAGIAISGGDYFTFNGIDIMVNSGSTPNYGYSLIAASGGGNGAQYNTIKNCKITLNKANTYTTGIYQNYGTTPTSTSGANSYNTYQNITIENAQNGFRLYGYTSTYPDLGNVIRDCTIGGATAGNMGGSGSSTSYTYGMYLYYQSGVQVFNNEIRNFAQTSYYSVYGIYMTLSYGANQIYNNKIHDMALNYNSASYYVYGMYLSLGSGTNSVKVYNNMIWNLSHTLYSSTTSSYLVYGIYNAGSTNTNTYYIDFNTVAITGPTYANSVCYYTAAVTAVNYTRNNVFANLTPSQTGTPKHYCYYTSGTASIGYTNSVSNNNVLYVASSGNGYIGRASTADKATISDWQGVVTGLDSNSRPTNPQFISVDNPHIQTGISTPVESNGSYFTGAIDWVTTDLDGNPRYAQDGYVGAGTAPDIGADEGGFNTETICQTPTAQPTNLVLLPYPTAISGTFTASLSAEAYLVVRHTDATHNTPPTNLNYYAVGGTLGNGTIVQAGPGTSFTAASLTANTTYNFTIYAYNFNGIGGPLYLTASPLVGTKQTMPAAPNNPQTFTATPATYSQINLAATANTNGDNIMVAWNSTATFGTPVATGYVAGNAIDGGGIVLYVGPASSLGNHTGLDGNTTYYYKAWSFISADRTTYYAYSTGLAASASTPQVPATMPFTEGFEVWPNSWGLANGTQTNKWEVGTATYAAGSKSAYISDNGGTTNTYSGSSTIYSHLYRDITFPTGAAYYDLEFSWKCYGESNYDYLQVFLVETITTPVAGTALSSGQIGAARYNRSYPNWNRESITLSSSLAGTTKRLVFSWKNDGSVWNNPPIAIDNIKLNGYQTEKPTALTATLGTDSALANWTSSLSSFNMEVCPLYGTPTGTPTYTGISKPYPITGLAAGTGYSYYVQAISGAELSSWAGPFMFYTTFSAPLTENFDGATPPFLPNAWNAAVNSVSALAVVQSSTTTPVSTPNSGYLYNPSSNAGANVSLISPPFPTPMSSLYTRFSARATVAGRVLLVGVVPDPSNTAAFTQVASISLSTTHTIYLVDFSAYGGTNQYIAFKLDTGDTTASYVYLDDIRIGVSPYNELAVTSFTTTPLYKFDSVEFTFNVSVLNNGVASSGKSVTIKEGTNVLGTVPVGDLPAGSTANLTWNWAPSTPGTYSFSAEVPSDENNANNTATLTGQVVYPNGSVAEGFEDIVFPPTRWMRWDGAQNYVEWNRTASNFYDGAYSASLVLSSATTASHLATPWMTFSTTRNTFTFRAKSTTAGSQIQIKYAATDDSTAAWSNTLDLFTLGTTYTQYTVSTGSLNGNYRIAFMGVPNGTTGTISIDNVVGPEIFIPSDPPGPCALVLPDDNSLDIDPLTVVLTWTAPGSGGDAVGYDVRIHDDPNGFSGDFIDGAYEDYEGQWYQTSNLNFDVAAEGSILAYDHDWYWQVVPYDANDQRPRLEDCEIFKFTTRGRLTVPTILNLGNVFPTGTKTGTIALQNTSTGTVVFTPTGTDFSFTAPYQVAGSTTLNLPYTFTAPATLGSYNGTIYVTETSAPFTEYEIPVEATITSDIVVGTGTDTTLNLPIYPYFGYSYSQVIYPSSWIQYPAGYQIEKLYYQYASADAPNNTQNFKIWMGHTDQGSFPSTGASWLPVNQMTLVFDGVWNITAGAGWKEIVLQTPFLYNGTQNLVIAVDENTPGYNTGRYFYQTPTTGTYYGLYYGSDSTNPDPTNPTVTPTSKAGYPNTKFVLGALPAEASLQVNPGSWTTSVTLPTSTPPSQQFAITNGGMSTLHVTSVGFGPESSEFFTCSNFPGVPFDLDLGDPARTFNVTYNPTSGSLAGTQHTGTILINGVSYPLTGTCYDPRINSLPYSQNFDTVTTPNFPMGWTALKTYSSSSLTTSTTYNQSSPNSVYMYNYTTTETMRLISPQVTVPITTIKLTFYLRATATGYTLKVGTVNTLDASGTFTPVATITPTVTGSFVQYSVPFNLYEGSDQYICFQHGVEITYKSFYLDTILMEPMVANDMAATAITGPTLAIAGQPVSYTITVMNNGTAPQASYTVNLKKHGDDRLASIPGGPLNPGLTATHTFNYEFQPSDVGSLQLEGEVELATDENNANNVTSILPVTVYPAGTWVEDFSGTTVPGDWTIRTADTGAQFWGLSAEYPRSTPNSMGVRYDSTTLTNNDWLITPALQLSSSRTDDISFWLGKSSTSYSEEYEVWLSTTGNQIADFIYPLETGGTLAQSLTGYVNKSYNLDTYGDAVVYVAIRYMAFNKWWLYADDFVGPPLYVPAAPEVTVEKVPTGFKLTWPANAYAKHYKIYADDDPDGAFSGTPATTASNEYIYTGTEAKKFFKVIASTTPVGSKSSDTILQGNPPAESDIDKILKK